MHGASRDALAYCRRVVEVELASVVDNPVVVGEIDGDGYEVMSTGNFHGQPLAFAGDMLAMAAAELGSISERRVYRLLDPATSRGLPPFLAREAGTNSGFMLAQYTAASLVAEDKVLAHPAGVDSIPTSGNQEDHVSMGWHAARKAGEVLATCRRSSPSSCSARPRRSTCAAGTAAPGPAAAAVHAVIRAHVPADGRRPRGDPADRGRPALLPELVTAAEAVTGRLA